VLRLFKKSWQAGTVTTAYPKKREVPPNGFRGLPEWAQARCTRCGKCAVNCPTQAIELETSGAYWSVTAKKCIFCGYCEDACEHKAISLGSAYELAELGVGRPEGFYNKSVHIRHLDSGSCNGCEWEMVNLTGPVYDLQRLGFDFVASPKHADLLMVTGPVTRNLEKAVRKTFEAVPAPKLVVAVGTCACSGGICGRSYASSGGVDNILPVNAYIPGCPPRPQALIHGLLKAVGRQ